MLKLYFLGQPRIEDSEGKLIKLKTSKHSYLLSYLWLERKEFPKNRSILAEEFWSNPPYKNPLGNLKSALSDICKNLNTSDGLEVILRTDTTARFDPKAICWIDVEQFEQLLDEAEDAPEEIGLQLRKQAVEEIYIDDFVMDCHGVWDIEFERSRLIDRYVEALEWMADIYRQQKDYKAGIECCKKMLTKKPLREEIYQDLIFLHSEIADLDTAIQYYEDCKKILNDVMGRGPSDYTERVLDQAKRRASPEKIDQIIQEAKLLRRYPELIVPYVGRERELEQIGRAWNSATEGNGRTILIGGEAGIGKTELAKQLLLHVQGKGGSTVWGACSEIGSTTPYQPWIEILREVWDLEEDSNSLFEQLSELSLGELMKLMPELSEYFPEVDSPAALLKPEHEQTRIFEAITQAFMLFAQDAPLFIFIDDLQWADESSIQYLRYLARAIAEENILLVGALRLEDIGEDHPLMSLLGTTDSDSLYVQIQLRPLEKSDSEALITDTLKLDRDRSTDLIPRLIDYSKGNPLYMVEILHWLIEEEILFPGDQGVWLVDTLQWEILPAPPGVGKLISKRLSRIGKRSREILEIASTRPINFDISFLIKTLFRPKLELVHDLEELLRIYLVQAHPRGYEFRHALIRQAVYESLTLEAKQTLHLRAGEAIELLFESGEKRYGIEVVGEMAHHFYIAEEKPKSLNYSLKAGDHAWSTSYAKTESLTNFERALELAEELGDEEGMTLALKGLGEVCCFTDEPDQGLEYCEKLAVLELDRTEIAEIYLWMANAQHLLRDLEMGIELCEKAINNLGEVPDPLTAARAHYFLSTFLNWRSKFDLAISHCDRAVEFLETQPDTHLESLVYAEYGQAYTSKNDHEKASKFLLRSAEIANSIKDYYSIGYSQFKLGIAYDRVKKDALAEEALKSCLRAFEHMDGHRDALGAIHNRLTYYYLRTGKLDQALIHAEEQIANYEAINEDGYVGMARGMLACLLYAVGETQRSERLFEAAIKTAPTSGSTYFAIVFSFVYLCELNLAFEWLEKGISFLQPHHLNGLLSGPIDLAEPDCFDEFRSDPRFHRLMPD